MSDFHYEDNPFSTVSSRFPFINLVARVATLASLLVSLIILKVDTVTYDNGFVLTYDSYFLSYEYMFYISAIGIAYSFFQIPSAVYNLKTGKRLLQSHRFTLVDFYGDKFVLMPAVIIFFIVHGIFTFLLGKNTKIMELVLTFLLGTGVGAAFGATRDLKKYLRDADSKADQFFNMAYIAAVFLFMGYLASIVSSILSSLGLAKRE